jgi:hypothetical protein
MTPLLRCLLLPVVFRMLLYYSTIILVITPLIFRPVDAVRKVRRDLRTRSSTVLICTLLRFHTTSKDPSDRGTISHRSLHMIVTFQLHHCLYNIISSSLEEYQQLP